MILEPKEIAIAYRCPECTSTVMSAVGLLSLSGDLMKLKCDCKESELVITRTSDGEYRFTVPCVFCGTTHSFLLSRQTLTSSQLFTIPCSYVGIDILFIGGKDQVLKAIADSDRILDELMEENSPKDLHPDRKNGESGDAHLQDLVMFSLGQLCEEGNIKCGCEGGGDYLCEPYPDRVEISCKKCGRKRVISCEEGSLSAHVLFDCDTLTLLPPEESEEKK